ncbi:MAG: Cna B-type domain-containing protein, partial [Lachnospiraceae bacterium]|nr:Cna B-type domain-containing protein [Lachnospiraceae bacterium]
GGVIKEYEYRFLETDASGNPFVPLGYSLTSATSDYVNTNNGSEDGYSFTFDPANNTYETAIHNTLITKDITVEKVWADQNDLWGIRPGYITLNVTGAEVSLSNQSEGITAVVSADRNTWTYTFTGLPKYAYGAVADPAHPTEISYVVTEDVDTPYADGFVLGNYYDTAYIRTGDHTRITNTGLQNDGTVLLQKIVQQRGTEDITNSAFPFEVDLIRTDGTSVPFTGVYYLYSLSEVGSLSDNDLREDAFEVASAYDRIRKETSNGIVQVKNGQIAVLMNINSRYQYKIIEKPAYFGYEVYQVENGGVPCHLNGYDANDDLIIEGATEQTKIQKDTEDGSYFGSASGQVPDIHSPAKKVIFTNRITDPNHHFMKVENTTPVVHDGSTGEALTGGKVKIYENTMVSEGAGDYVDDETPYVEKAVSVEFEPDTDNDYTFDNSITVKWWNAADDQTREAPHCVTIQNYMQKDSEGNDVLSIGGLQKSDSGELSFIEPEQDDREDTNNSGSSENRTDPDDVPTRGVPNADTNQDSVPAENDEASQAEITEEIDTESGQTVVDPHHFMEVWSPLLADDSPFKDISVKQGSVVLMLASSYRDMPAKTLVQVSFKAPEPAPAPAAPALGGGTSAPAQPGGTGAQPSSGSISWPMLPVLTALLDQNKEETEDKDEDKTDGKKKKTRDAEDSEKSDVDLNANGMSTDNDRNPSDLNTPKDSDYKIGIDFGVKTGDEAPIGALLTAFVLLMAAFAGVLFFRARSRKRQRK